MDTLDTQLALSEVIRHAADQINGTPTNQWTEGLVLSRLELLTGYWTEFTANHVVVLGQLDRNDAYLKDNMYYVMEAVVVQAKGRLYDERSRLSRLRQPAPSPPELPALRGSSKLPKITLPTFDGSRTQWESYRDMFKSLVHGDASLSNVDKLYFLKTSVLGEAKIILDSLQVTESNYAIAWSLLESRYDHQRLLTQEHLKAIKSMHPLKDESASGLQALLDELRRHRDQLRSLDRPVDSWDDWFVSFATDAMDPTTRRGWEEELETLDKTSNGAFIPTFTTLSDFLQCRCRTLTSLITGKTSKSGGGFSKPSPLSTSHPRALRTVAATATETIRCVACQEPHYVGRCATYKRMTPKERHDLAVRERLCYNCLRIGHSVRTCPSPMTCQACGAQHHTTLHDASAKRQGSPATHDVPSKPPKQNDKCRENLFTTDQESS